MGWYIIYKFLSYNFAYETNIETKFPELTPLKPIPQSAGLVKLSASASLTSEAGYWRSNALKSAARTNLKGKS